MALCYGGRGHGVNKFLFEVMPHRFPSGFLDSTEIMLWGKFYEEQSNING